MRPTSSPVWNQDQEEEKGFGHEIDDPFHAV
jgi:hypothetical protein